MNKKVKPAIFTKNELAYTCRCGNTVRHSKQDNKLYQVSGLFNDKILSNSHHVCLCRFCKQEYSEPSLQLHWNNCAEWHRHSLTYPPVTMPPTSTDWAERKRSPLMEKVNVCPHCLASYNYSWNDHAETCGAVAVNKKEFEHRMTNAS